MSSDRVTSTESTAPAADAGWLCAMLQMGDSFYPTGSYAHSFGLEGLVHSGVVTDRGTLRTFLFTSALPGLTRTDLPIVTHAWHALAAGDWICVEQLCELSSALRTSAETRRASEAIGRQRAELAAALHPGSVAAEYLQRATVNAWPFSSAVSAAVEARAVGAPLVAAQSAFTYATLGALLGAAMKLLRLGQNGAQTLLTDVLAETPRLIATAETVPFDEIGWFNPWLDIASARHERADARMFIS